jgi:aminopeptidase N
MLHTLRGVLGDSVFTAFLREYYRRGVLRHPMPEDVRAAAEAASGRDLSGFFHSWVETLEQPSFSLTRHRSKRSEGTYTTSLLLERKGEMVFPVTVQALFKEGTIEVNIDGRKQVVGPGSVVFFAVNENENMTNVGKTQATYLVLQWFTPLTPKI